MNKERNPQRKKPHMSIRQRLEKICDEFNEEWGLEPLIEYEDIDDANLSDIIKEEAYDIEEGDQFSQIVLDSLKELGIDVSKCIVLEEQYEEVEESQDIVPPKKMGTKIKVDDVIKPNRGKKKKMNRETAMVNVLNERRYYDVCTWADKANDLYSYHGGKCNIKQTENMIKVALRTLLAVGYIEMKKVEGIKMYRITSEGETMRMEVEVR